MSDLFCGIDFGTSNSTVSLADRDKSWLIALEGDEVTLPSAVFWEADGAPPQFGRAAIAAYVSGEDGRLMRGLKSTLGSSLIDERTAVGGRSVSFVDVLSRFFGQMRRKLDAATDGVTRVVLGRPVHFVDDDASADAKAQAVLEQIAGSHGFTDVLFQYEPIAAALQYEQSVQADELVLIVDIGGGTSDFSVYQSGPDGPRILASHGIRLGGTDFDHAVSMTHAMPLLGQGGQLRRTFGPGLLPVPNAIYAELATWAKIPFLYTAETRRLVADLIRHAVAPDIMGRLGAVIERQTGHALAFAVEAGKIAANGRKRVVITSRIAIIRRAAARRRRRKSH